jgi:hypothetical protein
MRPILYLGPLLHGPAVAEPSSWSLPGAPCPEFPTTVTERYKIRDAATDGEGARDRLTTLAVGHRKTIRSLSANMITMSVPAMTRDQLFDWAEAQGGRYEFDGFQPVAMTGGNLNHNQIAFNIHVALRRRLGGTECRPLGLDAGVATVGDIVRYPDGVVTRSTVNGAAVLSPTPSWCSRSSVRHRAIWTGSLSCANTPSSIRCVDFPASDTGAVPA